VKPTRTARLLIGLAVVLAVLTPGAPAWAHNALAEATPPKDATLEKAPTGVRLRFLQKLDPAATTITVTDAGKQPVAASKPEVDGATGSITFTEPPANGVYTVAYNVTSRDGHLVKGSYKFTVDDPDAPAAASAAPPAAASTAPAATSPAGAAALENTSATSESAGSPVAWIVAAAVVLLAAVGTFLFLRRRRSA
jgi:methionine-rich copper-binding protein CopC